MAAAPQDSTEAIRVSAAARPFKPGAERNGITLNLCIAAISSIANIFRIANISSITNIFSIANIFRIANISCAATSPGPRWHIGNPAHLFEVVLKAVTSLPSQRVAAIVAEPSHTWHTLFFVTAWSGRRGYGANRQRVTITAHRS
jgi:hypothetical protein